MADQVEYPGRLIAVDGSRGKDSHAAAKTVVNALRKAGVECAISRWDASGLFGELAATARGDRHISARTLALVYAADLAFRMRWEIRPVLEAGGVVIAAPYIDTAIAFAGSRGLSDEWIRDLLRFVPQPDLRGRAEEHKVNQPWKKRTDRGFPEYCAAMLDASAPKKLSKHARHDMMRLLEQQRGRRIVTLDDQGVEAMVKAVTGSRKAAPRRSASRPRSGRK
jgi:hypothetical protein